VRCFVAFDLPRPVCNHLAKVTGPLQDRFDVRWVPPEQMHVTTLFAGDVDAGAVEALAEQVESCELPAVTLHLEQLGVFPPRGIPRLVWAGLGGDVDLLRAARERFEAAAEPLGVARDKRAFTPHVTLGRVKSPFGVLALIDQLAERSSDLNRKPFSAASLTLYESRLTPRGPRYEVIARQAVGGSV